MNTKNILIGLGALVILLLVISYFKDKEKVCYMLPKSSDPKVFGPKYWAALHNITERIPCGTCRGFAEKFAIFWHDFTNVKLGKSLYDENNFNYFTDLIGKIKANNNTWVA